jgi:thioredoxin-like negative regulator of GroEL
VNTLRHPRVAGRFGIQAVPAFAVLSPQGETLAVTVGAMTLQQFKAFLDRNRS